MIAVGLVGYVETPRGLRTLCTVFAGHLSEEVRRRFIKNWYKSKKKAFTKYSARVTSPDSKEIADQLDRMKKYCSVIRLIAHTQIRKLKHLHQKKAHLMEIQINGGQSVADKIDFGYQLFEHPIPISSVFAENEMIDTIAVTRGHGFSGVVKRWGVRKLPRKTHRCFMCLFFFFFFLENQSQY